MNQHETMTPAEARRIVDTAAELYFEERRRRVDSFVDRHFSIAGSLVLHRKALGGDILRAPLNIALAIPYFALQVGGAAARACRAERLARHLRSRRILLKTAVAREIEWLLVTDLLELPFRQGNRVSTKDAMAEAILAQEPVGEAVRTALDVVRRYAAHPDFRRQLEESVMKYTDSRAAGAEIATTLIALGTGAAALQQVTPGALVLGPALAAAIAQQTAVASFPLGPTLGALWYGAFPAAASPGLVAMLTAGAAGAGAIVAAFVGVLTDPLQRVTGLHRRRLLRLIGAVHQQFATHDAPAFITRDHYVARLLGLMELAGSVHRLAK
jgi:hypothetical protein